MILLTATFADNNWFATWLTPTVQIVEALSWATSTHNMTEVTPWNYLYQFNEYNEAIVYFFNYDAWTDDVNNRYMWSNNNEVKVVYQMSGWTNASVNEEKKKEKEFIDKIVDAIKKEYPDYIPNIDYIKDKLIKIEDNINDSDADDICWTILNWIELSEIKIVDKINSIPKIDEDKLVKKLSIDKPVRDIINKIESIKFSYDMDWLKEEIISLIKRYWYKKKLTANDLWTIIPIEYREEFKSLLKS